MSVAYLFRAAKARTDGPCNFPNHRDAMIAMDAHITRIVPASFARKMSTRVETAGTLKRQF